MANLISLGFHHDPNFSDHELILNLDHVRAIRIFEGKGRIKNPTSIVYLRSDGDDDRLSEIELGAPETALLRKSLLKRRAAVAK